MSWHYTIHKSEKNEKYYFNLHAGNGQIILSSQWYESKQWALGGIDSIRENSGDESAYESSESDAWKFHFVLKANNGEIVGTSQVYTGMDGCAKGILSVMENWAATTVREESQRTIRE